MEICLTSKMLKGISEYVKDGGHITVYIIRDVTYAVVTDNVLTPFSLQWSDRNERWFAALYTPRDLSQRSSMQARIDYDGVNETDRA